MTKLEKAAAWVLAILWLSPLLYAFWAAFHPPEFATPFAPLAPLTLANFEKAWSYAPFARHFVNTVMLVTTVLAAQLVLCTLAGFAFARFDFAGRDIAFALVLLQLMIMPEVLIVENYRTMSKLGLVDTILGIGLPYMASAFGIFLLRQTFKTIPRELEEAARVEGCSWLGVLWRVYVPLARPTYLAYALVSVSYHWNNFLWPLVVTNSVNTRPLTVGLAIFGAPESGVDWSVISAGTLIAVAPLLAAAAFSLRCRRKTRTDPVLSRPWPPTCVSRRPTSASRAAPARGTPAACRRRSRCRAACSARRARVRRALF